MATIKKQGTGYKITVSNGYDINGKQIREHMTWSPTPGMTAKQAEKELNRQAVLFEEQVKTGATHDGNTRLVDFTEIFMREYARPNLKDHSLYNYETRMQRVNLALGHIKLKDLRPGHIASFYANLGEEGIRSAVFSTAKADIGKLLKERGMTMAALSAASGVSEGTIRSAKSGKRISKKCADAIVAALGTDYAKLFNTEHDMTPLKAGTVQSYHRVLSAVLCRAVKWGYIQSNPASRVDLPSIAGRHAAYLDEPDARRLLDLLQHEPIKWRTIMTFDLLSGLRRGELAGLRWQDIDADRQLITIRQTLNYVPKKGVYIDTPKTPTSQRSVWLSQSAFILLAEYKEWQDAQREKLGDAWEGDDDRIFTGDLGGPLFPDSISQWFHKFVLRTGLPPVTVHSLRHTYASLMISDGVPLVIVSHQMGHAQPSTTTNIYAHAIAAAEARSAKTFDRFNDIVAPELVEKQAPETKASGQ